MLRAPQKKLTLRDKPDLEKLESLKKQSGQKKLTLRDKLDLEKLESLKE